MDPGTAILVSSAIMAAGAGASGANSAAQQKKIARMKAKETKRETYASLLNDALNADAELETQRMRSRGRLGQRKARSFQDTSDLVRGALSI